MKHNDSCTNFGKGSSSKPGDSIIKRDFAAMSQKDVNRLSTGSSDQSQESLFSRRIEEGKDIFEEIESLSRLILKSKAQLDNYYKEYGSLKYKLSNEMCKRLEKQLKEYYVNEDFSIDDISVSTGC